MLINVMHAIKFRFTGSEVATNRFATHCVTDAVSAWQDGNLGIQKPVGSQGIPRNWNKKKSKLVNSRGISEYEMEN